MLNFYSYENNVNNVLNNTHLKQQRLINARVFMFIGVWVWVCVSVNLFSTQLTGKQQCETQEPPQNEIGKPTNS